MDMNQVTSATLDSMKKALQPENLAKAMTTAQTGFQCYNLEPVARSMVPFDSPERNKIYRKVSKGGTAVHFKTIESIRQSGGLGRSEGERGNRIVYTTAEHDFSFRPFGVSDGVTREQIAAARGFEDDLWAKQHTFALLRMMTGEEMLIVGGNRTALGTVSAPTCSVVANGGSVAAGTVSVKVAALTLFAAEQGVVFDKQYAGITLNGVPVNDASGSVIANAVNGATAASAAGTATATDGCAITATVKPVKGAVAYAWFAGASGSETLQMVTASSTATLTQIVTGGDAVSGFAVDGSGDAEAFDGYLPQIINGGGYFYDAAAAQLTATDSGVKEIDDLNAAIYSQYKLSPSRYIMGLQAYQDVTNAVVKTGGAPTLMIQNSADTKANIVGGYRVTSYVNKATGTDVPFSVHPWLPPSTIICITDTIPYPNADIPRAIEMELGFDYMAEDYAPQKPTLEFSISAYGCLKMYAPRFCGVITNLKSGVKSA